MRKFIFERILPRFFYIAFGINIQTAKIALEKDDKCLCLAPHPDDESIGCGGILSLFPENFKVICLTDGSRSGSDLSKEELVATRRKEFESAMEISGVKNFEMLDIPDRKLVLHTEEYKKIDISEYDYIFLPNPLDQHRDHKSASAVLSYLLHNQKVKKNLKIVFYEVWNTLILQNAVADITSVVEKKRKMIEAHMTQTASTPYTEKILALNNYRGLLCGTQYAEAFLSVDVTMFMKIFKNIIP